MKSEQKTKARPQASRRRLDQLVQLLISRGWKWVGAFGHQIIMPPDGDPRWNWPAIFIPYGKAKSIPHWAEHELNPTVEGRTAKGQQT